VGRVIGSAVTVMEGPSTMRPTGGESAAGRWAGGQASADAPLVSSRSGGP
jgi:hypothetical protein